MSNVVEFLESLGSSAASNQLSATAYNNAVEALGLEATVLQPLLARDVSALNESLGLHKQMHCGLFVPD
jgi:hypothetical protein